MSDDELQVQRDVPLAPRTTFELGGTAEYFAQVTTADALTAGLRWAAARALPVTVLGGGSNVLVADAGVRGLVLAMGLRGREVRRVGDQVELTVGAGERWDELVEWTVAEGWVGLECLSGIPGLAGATPVQNVGAYGQEVAHTITEVEVVDARSLERARWSAQRCAFGYRDSALKRAAGQSLVTQVTFRLAGQGLVTPRYGELSRALGGRPAPVAEVRQAVLALRRSKSMVYEKDDPNHRSAGSFFTNPVVSAAQAAEVAARALARGLGGSMPRWDQPDGRVKLAAGWLVEQAGFQKGLREGHVGLSSAHALALVHHGGGTTRELLAFAGRVVAGVREAFGVELEREPVLLG